MRKIYAAVLVVITLLALTSYAAAQEPVGADCTDPPNLVPSADLRNCDLSGRQMAGANLYDADLSGANLSGANLSGAQLGGADLTGANLTGATLDNADLFTTTLIGAIFDDASLRNANLEDGYAVGAGFINADLRGANLYFAFIRDADLSGANLGGMWLASADFEGSTLQNAVFAGSDMRFLDMRNTDLRGADLSDTKLLYVSLTNADLRNATLLGADDDGGNTLTGIMWGNTICADGSNSDADDGDSFTCVSNFVANQPPAIALTSPANTITVTNGDTVSLSASAADSDGVVIRVEFFAGSTLVNIDPSAPYSFNWTTTAAGTFAITARATDDDLATTTSQAVTVNVVPSPNNAPPTVSLTSPSNGATVYRFWGTTLRANASDADGAVTRVEFYAGSTLLGTDTSAPYSLFWRPASRGNQTLSAKAYDDDGAVTSSAAVTVRVR